MASLSEVSYNARELISLSGRNGLLWSDLSNLLGLENHQLKTAVAGHLRLKGYEIRVDDNFFDGDLQDLTIDALFIAPSSDMWKFLGISSPLDIPPDPGLQLLEFIASSKSRGVVLSEVTLQMKSKHLHPITEKLCSSGLIVKRLISPVGGIDARVNLRTTIFHLKRFAPIYNPRLDGVYISDDDVKNELLQRDILHLMRNCQVRELSLPEMTAPLGFSHVRELRKRLEACISQMKGDCKFYLFSQSKPNSYSSLSSWYVGLVDEDDDDEEDMTSQAPAHTIMSLPLIDQAMHRLNSCATGVPSSKLRDLLGASVKRAAMVVTTLLKEYGVESYSVQMGRQKAFCLCGPHVYPHAVENADVLRAVLEGRSIAQSVVCKDEPSVLEPTSRSSGVEVAAERGDAPSQDFSMVATTSPSAAAVDLHTLRRQIAIDLVDECGGLVDLYTVGRAIQASYQKNGIHFEVDKKTILRIFEQLSKGDDAVFGLTKQAGNVLNTKLVILFRKDLSNLQSKIDAYRFNMEIWWKRGKIGQFRNEMGFSSHEVVNITDTPASAMERKDNIERLLVSLPDCAPFSALLPLPPLSEANPEPWKCDRVSMPDEVDKSLSKSGSIMCIRLMMDLSNQLLSPNGGSVDERNTNFLNSLYALHATLMKQGQRLATKDFTVASSSKLSDANVYIFNVLDCVLKMPFRHVMRKYGLPREFVEWNVEGAAERIPAGHHFAKAAISARVSMEQVLRHEDRVTTLLAQAMVSQAFRSLKYELMALASLGLLTILPDNSRSGADELSSNDEFDYYVGHNMKFKLSMKKKRSDHELQRYWEFVVGAHITNVRTELGVVGVSLRDRVSACYALGIPRCHEIPDLPPLPSDGREVDELVTSHSSNKKRVRQSKGNSSAGEMTKEKKINKKARVSAAESDLVRDEGDVMEVVMALSTSDCSVEMAAAVAEDGAERADDLQDAFVEDRGGDIDYDNDDDGKASAAIFSLAEDMEGDDDDNDEGEELTGGGSAIGRGEIRRRRRQRSKLFFETCLTNGTDEDAGLLSGSLHKLFVRPTLNRIPDILKESTIALVADAADASVAGQEHADMLTERIDSAISTDCDGDEGIYPWHHPYRQILRANYEVLELAGPVGDVGVNWGNRELGRRAGIVLEKYSTLRQATARAVGTLGASCFDGGEGAASGSRETRNADDRTAVSAIINDILDSAKYEKFSDLFTSRLDEAAMTRALQVYASSPSVLNLFSSSDLLDTEEDSVPSVPLISEEELAAEKTSLAEGLLGLRKFPFAVMARVHRELFGKKYLARRIRGSKRKAQLFEETNGFEFQDRFLGSIMKGLTKLFWTLQQTDSTSGIGSIISSDRSVLNADTPHLSSIELLELLHVFAGLDGCFPDASVSMVPKTENEEEEGGIEKVTVSENIGSLIRVSVGKRCSEQCVRLQTVESDASRAPCVVCANLSTVRDQGDNACALLDKTIGQTSTGRGADILNEITVLVSRDLTASNCQSHMACSEIVEPLLRQSESEEKCVEETMDLLREVILEKCSSIQGSTVDTLLNAIMCHPNISMALNSSHLRQHIDRALSTMCSENVLCKIPFYNSRYEEVPFYVVKAHEGFYLTKQSEIVGEELNEGHVINAERACPWTRYDGCRNQKLFNVFASRVAATLTKKPKCCIEVIHSELPMLTPTHICVLMDRLIKDGIVEKCVVRTTMIANSVFGEPMYYKNLICFSLNSSTWSLS